MKRREFSSLVGTTAWAAATGMAGLASSAQAQSAGPVAGKDYAVVEPRAGVEAPKGKIEVVEFFWYNCPHCNVFEPALSAWVQKLPKDVAFRRVPRRFADNEAAQQQLYYALESMGLLERLHAKVFRAVHVEKITLNAPEAIANWVEKQGVDKAKFVAQFNSFSVVSKAAKAAQLQAAYKIEGVPALGVAGRYLTDGQMAGSNERALQVVDALVASVRSGR